MLHDSKVGCFACIAICRSHVLICTSFSSCSLFLELHHAGHAPAQRQAVLLRRCVWLVCAGLRMGFRGQCSGFWGQSCTCQTKELNPFFFMRTRVPAVCALLLELCTPRQRQIFRYRRMSCVAEALVGALETSDIPALHTRLQNESPTPH